MKLNIQKAFVFILLVFIIVAARTVSHIPNMAPVVAVGLFAAFYFRKAYLAMAVPAMGMLISDLFFVGTYNWEEMAMVYLGLTLPAFLGFWIAKPLPSNMKPTSLNMVKVKGGKLVISAVAASTFFFFLSNLGVWLFSGMYALTFKGFTLCFASALPFYKFSLVGDAAYSIGIFAIVAGLVWMWNTVEKSAADSVSSEA